MKIAYFDCFAGASGDMILGALLDAGLSLDALNAELGKLPLSGYQLSAQRAQRGPIAGTQVIITTPTDEHGRSLDQILGLIGSSDLSEETKEQSAAIFQRLGAAEAKVHGIPVEEVHFHELGAMDTILDIVGAVSGLHLLGVEAVFASPFPTGTGTVRSAHGVLPVPAPATLELLAMARAPLQPSADASLGELVTPTGAAIITTLASFQQPRMSLERVGYGVGAREIAALPNVLRLWLSQAIEPEHERDILLLQTNIDDMNPELYGYVMERLFDRGAYDVWFTPIQMKKNRPATMLSVLAPAAAEGTVVETILRETSTLGVRVQRVNRHVAKRDVLQFESSLGQARVKLKFLGEAILGVAPEYEDCHRLALEHGLPLQEVYRIVASEARTKHLGNGAER